MIEVLYPCINVFRQSRKLLLALKQRWLLLFLDHQWSRFQGVRKRAISEAARWRLDKNPFDLFIQKIPTWLFITATVFVLAGLSLWVAAGKQPISSFRDVIDILLERADAMALVAAVVLYFKEAPERKQKNRYEAWQVLDAASASGCSTSYARIQALEYLARDETRLEKITLRRADLAGIDLQGAFLAGADLQECDLRVAHLAGAKLMGANLAGASLQRADLSKVDLRKTNLQGANLVDADLGTALFLWSANLKAASYNKGTQFPPDFDPGEVGMINREDSNDNVN